MSNALELIRNIRAGETSLFEAQSAIVEAIKELDDRLFALETRFEVHAMTDAELETARAHEYYGRKGGNNHV